MNYDDPDKVPAVWKVGDVILDRYEVRAIHEGGMGRVYRVYHREWRAELAVKTPHRAFFQNQQQRENFIRECNTWIDLGLHPNIVSCYFVRQLGGVPRIFAEYVDGGALREWIDARKLYEGTPELILERILDIGIQTAWGLQYAHDRGVIHQDVKPGNVLMAATGIARIADFGLAKARACAAESSIAAQFRTVLSSFGGMTPAYCSPEQAAGQMLTRRTDIWSWALSILEMFTGGVAWQSGLAAPKVLASCVASPKKGAALRLPDPLVGFLQQCFQRDPNDRPRNMEDCAKALTRMFVELIGRDFERVMPEPLQLTAATLNNRGVSLLELGRSREAEAAWNEALQFDPHHPEATYNHGLRLWRTAQITDDELVRRLREAQRTNPNALQLLHLLAAVHLERADNESARQCLEQIAPEDATHLEVEASLRRRIYAGGGMNTLRVFQGHEGSVTSAHLSADGRFAISGSADMTLRLWEVPSGHCIRVFKGHTERVNAVCLDATGSIALSASGTFKGADNTLRLWDVPSGRCLRRFEGHTRGVNAVCLSNDGRIAVSGSDDQTLRFWDTASGQCLRVVDAHGGGVQSISLSADGRFVLSGGMYDKAVRLWEMATGRCIRIFKEPFASGNAVFLSTDSRLALSGNWYIPMRMWDIATGSGLHLFKGHTNCVSAVCLSSDNLFALSASWDTSVRLWDATTGRCLRTFRGYTNTGGGEKSRLRQAVNSVCLSVDGRLALSASSDNTLRLWQLNKFFCAAPPALSRIDFRSLQTSQYRHAYEIRQAQEQLGQKMITAAAKTLRHIREQQEYERDRSAMELWQQLYVWLPHKAFRGGWSQILSTDHIVGSISLSGDSRLVLTGSATLGGIDDTVRLWDIATGRCLRTFFGHKGGVAAVCLSNDGRFALSAGGDKTLRLWDITTGRCLRLFEGHTAPVNSVEFTADDRFAFSGSLDKTVRLWELASGRCLRIFSGHRDSVQSVSGSRDGSFILSGSSGGKLTDLRLWDMATGRCVRIFEGHTEYVQSVRLSADGCLALSGSADHSVRLWELATGRCLRIFQGHEMSVTAVCLCVDNRFLLSGSCDSTVRLWEVATGRCLGVFEGHRTSVAGLCLSADGRFAVSAGSDNTLRLWTLDWELEDKEPADWDEGARPYLRNFLILHTPYAAPLPEGDQPDDQAVTLALTRRGEPSWTNEDFNQLLHTLGCAGYGWLRPEGVQRELEKMTIDSEQ
jgi:WD40 repeat protein